MLKYFYLRSTNLVRYLNGSFLLTDFIFLDMPGFNNTFSISRTFNVSDILDFITRIAIIGVDPHLLVKVTH